MSKHLQRTASGRFFEYMASSLCLPALFSERAVFLYYECELDKIKSGSSAVILCGGKSTRMAQDKAGLLIGKKTFLQQIEKNLKDADEILLSVKDRRDYPEIGARHIEDREADKGSAYGTLLGVGRMQL